MKTALQLAAEQRLRRSLTAGELLLDLAGANADLEAGKARLRAAIEKEKRRALRDVVRHGRASLNVTEEMRAALLALFASGQRHARAELAAHGLEPARALARDEPRLEWAWYSLGRYLHGIAGRIETAVGDVEPESLRDVSVTAMVRELDRRVPGALDAASRLVSGAFGSGLAAEFGTAGDVVTRWQYSAVMDAFVCPPCEEWDGEEFDSWAAISEILPDGGPNADCDGNGRCRCRPTIVSVG